MIVPSIVVCLGLGQMYSSWLWQRDFVDHKIIATSPLVPTGSYVMYPLKDFIAGIQYIQDNTARTDVILSEATAGNYIPVYSGNTVYVGHDNTVNAEMKKPLVTAFFSGQMRVDAAKAFVATNHFKLIFFGPQERDEAGGHDLTTFYPFVNAVYTNPQVIVYSLQ